MKKIGIIQSRGLGDIVIALPIALEYKEAGYDVYWPICENFISSFEKTVPWINWLPVPVDKTGLFFYEVPRKLLESVGITDQEDILYLYQYLSSHADLTDQDLFAMMKFDQYKYATAGVAFKRKWELDKCITRNPEREHQLYQQLVQQEKYVVYQQISSDVKYQIDLAAVDPSLQRIEITELTDCIFDWLKIIEGAEMLILIDSVFANIVDQLNLCPDKDKYFLRKWNRRVDGNPVFLQDWMYLPVQPPAGEKVTSLTDLVGTKK